MKKIKILAIVCVLVMATNVHATLQSRPGLDANVRMGTYSSFKSVREMEAQGGALGLKATFMKNDTTNEYEETSASNSIDSHMCKNTEWGAVAMLSVSNYGAGNGNVKDDYNSSTKMYGVTGSTTGNMTGIFGMVGGMAKCEYMAAGIVSQMKESPYLKSASLRYIDSYAESDEQSDFSRYIPGDATYETKSFGYSGTFVYNRAPIFARGSSDLFWTRGDSGNYSVLYGGVRAVIWVGDGI